MTTMREEERVEWLARAIEQMAGGREPDQPDDQELIELLKIARIRMDAAEQATDAGLETQEAILERLMARLRTKDSEHRPTGTAAAGDGGHEHITSAHERHDDADIHELQEVIDLRRQMAELAAEVSESHREAVWQKVQTRIEASKREKQGFLRWPFRRRDREAEEFGAALDRMTLGEPIWEAKDSRLEELLNVARLRHAAVATAGAGFADQQARVWGHIRPRLLARQMVARRPRVFKRRDFQLPSLPRLEVGSWPRLATAGAAVAVALAILAPMPATGFSDHPVAALARSVLGEHGAVTENAAPPTVPPPTEVVESNGTTAAEASGLLGRAVYEPTSLPEGYAKISSEYFAQSMTAEEGGLFVLAYENSTGADKQTLLVYQELASATNISVEAGFAQDIGLYTTGTPATYVSGTWRAAEGALTWGAADAQTIVFDLNGIRTIVQTSDPKMPITELAKVGSSLAEQAIP
ncbi:MAG: hypothetical protein WD379_04430 [Dehalococcoidia bacterium]